MTASDLLQEAAGRVPAGERDDPDGWRDAATRLALADALRAGDDEAVTALATGYDALLLLVPVDSGGGVALKSVGNGERRHRGAFSTPPGYADALAVRALPRSGPGKLGTVRAPSVVDPACGAGALLRAALDQLLAQGFSAVEAAPSLHGVDADPVAVELCRASLAAALVRAGHPSSLAELTGGLASRIVLGDALLGPTPLHPAPNPAPQPAPNPAPQPDRSPAPASTGFCWHETFPEVLAVPGAEVEPVTGWRGGFDAVLANPPWERLKVHARDWSGRPPPGLRDERAGVARALRAGGRHPLTATGELNAYLPFVETCWRLLAPGGSAAVLVPAGIASDRSAARLVEGLVAAGGLRRIHLFEPATPIFVGVSSRVAVAILELTSSRDHAVDEAIHANPPLMAIGLPGPTSPVEGREFALTPELLRLVNPNSGTTPLFGSPADAELVSRVHRKIPILHRHRQHRADEDGQTGGGDPVGPWGVRLVTSLHMTRDARWFRTAPGPGLVPLWEAKHCGLLDPLGGGTRSHRYWVPEELMHQRYPVLCERGWLAGYRNVSTAGSPRTLLPSPLPVAGVGNSLPLIGADRLPLLLAALSSLPVDYLLRQKHAGANVNFFKLEQVPVPPPAAYDLPAPWTAGATIAGWMLERLAEAVVWSAPGLDAFAAELGLAGVPEPLPEHEVLRARAEIDAAHAVLLGFGRADLEHALGTFGALRERERRTTGSFGTRERVLTAYARLMPD